MGNPIKNFEQDFEDVLIYVDRETVDRTETDLDLSFVMRGQMVHAMI